MTASAVDAKACGWPPSASYRLATRVVRWYSPSTMSWVGRAQDVVARQHEDAGLGLRLGRQGQVHGHLVAVEVRVERGADQRVDLDGLALDQLRLEGLDAQAVQRRRAVEQHRVL